MARVGLQRHRKKENPTMIKISPSCPGVTTVHEINSNVDRRDSV